MAERTKLWIAGTMKKLMEKKPLEKIRVKEICEAAEIERPTFYYHFKDKYDLVAWMFYSTAFDKDVTSFEDSVYCMNRMRDDYFYFFKRAYDDNSQNALWKYMLSYFVERHEKLAKDALEAETLPPQIAFSIRMYCYGCVGMTRKWFMDQKAVSAETVVKMMFTSMPQDLKEILRPET